MYVPQRDQLPSLLNEDPTSSPYRKTVLSEEGRRQPLISRNGDHPPQQQPQQQQSGSETAEDQNRNNCQPPSNNSISTDSCQHQLRLSAETVNGHHRPVTHPVNHPPMWTDNYSNEQQQQQKRHPNEDGVVEARTGSREEDFYDPCLLPHVDDVSSGHSRDEGSYAECKRRQQKKDPNHCLLSEPFPIDSNHAFNSNTRICSRQLLHSSHHLSLSSQSNASSVLLSVSNSQQQQQQQQQQPKSLSSQSLHRHATKDEEVFIPFKPLSRSADPQCVIPQYKQQVQLSPQQVHLTQFTAQPCVRSKAQHSTNDVSSNSLVTSCSSLLHSTPNHKCTPPPPVSSHSQLLYPLQIPSTSPSTTSGTLHKIEDRDRDRDQDKDRNPRTHRYPLLQCATTPNFPVQATDTTDSAGTSVSSIHDQQPRRRMTKEEKPQNEDRKEETLSRIPSMQRTGRSGKPVVVFEGPMRQSPGHPRCNPSAQLRESVHQRKDNMIKQQSTTRNPSRATKTSADERPLAKYRSQSCYPMNHRHWDGSVGGPSAESFSYGLHRSSRAALKRPSLESGMDGAMLRSRHGNNTIPIPSWNYANEKGLPSSHKVGSTASHPSYPTAPRLQQFRPINHPCGNPISHPSAHCGFPSSAKAEQSATFWDPNNPVIQEHSTLDAKAYGKEPVRRNAVRLIIKYLHSMNYPSLPSVKELLSPSTVTVYNSIITFMMYQYDPSLKDDRTLLEDKVPLFFRDAGYPTALAKSHMKSPTAPVTWPQHLAAMAWLCSLLTIHEDCFSVDYDLSITASRHDTVDVATTACTPRRIIGSGGWVDHNLSTNNKANYSSLRRNNQMYESRLPNDASSYSRARRDLTVRDPESPRLGLLRVIREAYQYHAAHPTSTAGADLNDSSFAEASGIRQIFDDAIQRWNERIDAETSTLDDEIQEAYCDLIQVEEEVKIPDRLKDRLSTLDEEERKLRDRVAAIQTKTHEGVSKIRQAEIDCDMKVQETEELEKELEYLKKRVANQAISREEVHRYRSDMERHQGRYDAAKLQKEKDQQQNWEIARQIDTVRRRIESTVDAVLKTVNQSQVFMPSGTRAVLLHGECPNPHATVPDHQVRVPRLTLDRLTEEELERLVNNSYATPGPQSSSEPVEEGAESVPSKNSVPSAERHYMELLNSCMDGVVWMQWIEQCSALIEAERKKEESLNLQMGQDKEKESVLIKSCKTKFQRIQDTKDDLERLQFDVKKETMNLSEAELESKRNLKELQINDENTIHNLRSTSECLLDEIQKKEKEYKELEEKSHLRLKELQKRIQSLKVMRQSNLRDDVEDLKALAMTLRTSVATFEALLDGTEKAIPNVGLLELDGDHPLQPIDYQDQSIINRWMQHYGLVGDQREKGESSPQKERRKLDEQHRNPLESEDDRMEQNGYTHKHLSEVENVLTHHPGSPGFHLLHPEDRETRRQPPSQVKLQMGTSGSTTTITHGHGGSHGGGLSDGHPLDTRCSYYRSSVDTTVKAAVDRVTEGVEGDVELTETDLQILIDKR